VWEALCAPSFTVPTLLLHGAADALVPAAVSRTLAERMPAASLVELPRSGHVPHEEEPARVAQEIDAFLARCLPGGERAGCGSGAAA